MIGIAFLLVGAAVGFGIAWWIRVPAIPMLILAGVIVAATGLVPTAIIEDSVVLGVAFLVFAAGIEMSPHRVGTQMRAALRVGAIQFALLGAAGLLTGLALGFRLQVSLYLALALTASSTLVVVRLLQRRQQLFEPFGRLIIGVLLLQDLLVIVLIPVVTRLPYGRAGALLGLAGALALVGLAFVLHRFAPVLLRRIEADEETLLLTVLALLFLYIGLADAMELPLIAAAFLAGVSLSAFPTSAVLRGQLNSLTDFFTAIFFTALGALLVLPTPTELLQALLLALLVIVLTPPVVVAVAERGGLSARSAIEAGLLLSQTSEFSLVVGLQALVLGHIGSNVFTIIALVTVITMILTPFIATDPVTRLLMRIHPLRREDRVHVPPAGHVLLLGCGDNGMPLLETLLAAGHEVLVVDDDPAVIRRLREGDVPCIRGDGSDPEVLAGAGADRARIIVSTLRRPADNLPVLDRVGRVPVIARVFDPIMADRIRERGGTPVVYAEAAARDFLRWFERTVATPAADVDGTRSDGAPADA